MITAYLQFERVTQRREPHQGEFGPRDKSHLEKPPPILRAQSYRGNTGSLPRFEGCQGRCFHFCLVSMKQQWADQYMKESLTYPPL